MNRFSKAVFSLLILFVFHTGALFAEEKLADCKDEDCIRRIVNTTVDVQRPELLCKGLKGKPHGFFERDSLEEICHLYVARRKAYARSRLKCSGEFDMDLSAREKLRSIIYHDGVFDQLSSSIRMPIDCRKAACGGNRGSTIYDSYNYSTETAYAENGKEVPVRFKTYLCVTDDGVRRYIPFFYALYIGGPQTGRLYTGYLETIPFETDPILTQSGFDGEIRLKDSLYRLVDFDGDGLRDLIFVEASKSGAASRVVLCLYRKGDHVCHMIRSPDIEIGLFAKLQIEVIPGKSILLRDTDAEKSYYFLYSGGTLKISDNP